MKKFSKANRHINMLTAFLLVLQCSPCMAKLFVTVSEEGKVFDGPSADYVTLNKNNEEVTLLPGMVFKCLESTNGWSLIEYSPGLRGYVSEQIETLDSRTPRPGLYNVANSKKETVYVKKEGDQWSLTVGFTTYSGSFADNAVIFYDANGNEAYSLADFGSGCVVMNYDNKITNFF